MVYDDRWCPQLSLVYIDVSLEGILKRHHSLVHESPNGNTVCLEVAFACETLQENLLKLLIQVARTT